MSRVAEMTLYQFMSAHPFLGLILIWSVYCLIRYAMRAVVIALRGWPPMHCDADGELRNKDGDE